MPVLPTELFVLGLSVVLLIVHIVLQAQLAVRDQGLDFNAGPRDGEANALSPIAARAERASNNFRETYPAFVALALGLAITGSTGGIGAVGAWLWFAARIVYIPLYLMGVPYIRTVAFGVSLIGIVLVVIRFF